MATELKRTFERNARAIELRPGLGQGTAITRARLRGDVGCEIEDGAWKFRVDLSRKSGGEGEAPDPGVYGRSALASCLASAYALWAAKLDIEIDDLTVEVRADYDARGMFGVDNEIADYPAIRYEVAIKSPAPAEAVEAMLDKAERHCNYFNVFTRPRELERTVRIEQ